MTINKRKSVQVKVSNVLIGGDAPVVIQSMTNTDTADVNATVKQIIELIKAGSEIVRITVNNENSAIAVPKIKQKLLKLGYKTPIVGDFHYNGHALLTRYPEMAKALDKYRINPGNVGVGKAHGYNFATMIKVAIKYKKPVRIGVNWGSLDQSLLTKLMDKNKANSLKKAASKSKTNVLSDREVLYEAMVQSALNSQNEAIKLGLPLNKIILSVKMSDVQDVILVNQMLAKRTDAAIHLGLTEAGMSDKGIVASVSALAVLLQQGIGDTIRVSLTPEPSHARAREVEICQLVLQTMGLRQFKPSVSSCPGCGRTSNNFYQRLAQEVNSHITKKMPEWRRRYPGVESLKIAVMGCVVNGPGESKHADIGISLPGSNESPIAPVYINGHQTHILKGKNIPKDFIKILEAYISKKYPPF